MKETKITKRIFAVFVAFIVILLISCGDLQVFAEQKNVIFETYCPDNSPLSWSKLSQLYGRFLGNINYSEVSAYSVSGSHSYSSTSSSGYVGLFVTNKTFPLDTAKEYYILPYTKKNNIDYYFTGGCVVYNDDSKFYFDSSEVIYFDFMNVKVVQFYDYSNNSADQVAFYFKDKSLEPTPTPEPATPTPVPTPTPEPTFVPDQPTYYTFFNHLLNDGNNALNALYLSWTQANNKFYTGIFFIGLPIMIGIFGIVASIFFGGDD